MAFSVSNNPATAVVVPVAAVVAAVSDRAAQAGAAEVFQEDASVSTAAQVSDAVAPASETAEPGGSTTDDGNTTDAASSENTGSGPQALTDEEQREVEALQARDREVRAHEQAHKAVAGQYARGGIQYTFERGPDGRLYAVGGQVNVDTSEIPNDPEATLRKAQILRRAALAPAQPSRQDRAVAAEMSRMAIEAMQEINAQAREEAAAAREELGTGSGVSIRV